MEIDPALSEPSDGQHQRIDHVAQRRDAPTEGADVPPLDPADVLKDYSLAVERAQTWTGVARFGFNAMLASADYKNKLRLKSDKMERILYFLTTPDAKSREKDRVDAQAKHQAQQWLLHEGILYRKESRLQQRRRHVAASESFDILTAEHLRSKHCGRDKMLKVLEAKYIGYTKDELMYVLDHCIVCSSKHVRGAAARRRESRRTHLEGNEMDGAEFQHIRTRDLDHRSMDKTDYLGAAIFWLYIIAALYFTALIIYTLLRIQLANDVNQLRTQRHTILFSILAACSFGTLSFNMLSVLIQSFTSWLRNDRIRLSTDLVSKVWRWSLTSTLFVDFSEAVVENNARCLWSGAALLTTFGVCLYMGTEGQRRKVPRLYAFFCLSQILPISFTQNLFYIALVRLPDHTSKAASSEKLLRIRRYLTTVYCVALVLLPLAARSAWLIILVLSTRLMLFAPMLIPEDSHTAREPVRSSKANRATARSVSGIMGPMMICMLVQIYLVLTEGWSLRDIASTLVEHPAVSSLGCDLLISLFSTAIWTRIRKSDTIPAKSKPEEPSARRKQK